MFICKRTFWKYAFFPLLINAALLVHLMGRDPGWWGLRSHYQRLGCLGLPVGGRPALVQGLDQGFLQSAPPQRLLSVTPGGPRLETTDTPGWSMYTVAEGTASQTFIFELQASGESLTFFPRASGADSSVEVAAFKSGDSGNAAPLARLAGKAGEWSPISARWSVPLFCLDRDRPIRLRVTLTGPWAQLWVKDGAAFFQ